MDKKEIYLFDLCGTLYFSNTTYDFLLWYFQKYDWIKFLFVKLALSFPLKVIWIILKLLGLSFDFRKKLIATLKGEDVLRINEEAKLFASEFLANRRNPFIHELLDEAKKKGAVIILVSASIEPVVKVVSSLLGFEKFLATTLEETVEGKFSGKINQDLQGIKLEALQKKGIDFYQEITLATDNKEDLPLAEVCKNVYIVSKKRKSAFWYGKQRSFTHWQIIHV